jgi:hypothetical protein
VDVAPAVMLLGPDLFSKLWPWITDPGSKARLRAVNKAMLGQVALTMPVPQGLRQGGGYSNMKGLSEPDLEAGIIGAAFLSSCCIKMDSR